MTTETKTAPPRFPVRLRTAYGPLFRGHQLLGVALLLIALVATYLTPQGSRGTALYQFGHFISNPFHTTYLTLSILLLIGTAWFRKCKPSFFYVVVALLIETVIMQGVKLSTFHAFGWFPRPSGGDGGFPSGHTASHCLMAYLLTEKYPRFAPFWYTCAGLVSWSRWEVGAHYPYQILAGAVLGLSVAVLLSPRFVPVSGYNKPGDPNHVHPEKSAR